MGLIRNNEGAHTIIFVLYTMSYFSKRRVNKTMASQSAASHSAIHDRFRDLHQDSDFLICVSALQYVMRSSCLPSKETYAC